MPRMPAWSHHLRPYAVPIWVAIGIVASIGLYQTLVGTISDGFVLNEPFLMSRMIEHVLLSAAAFAIVTAVGVPLGVLIAQAGPALRVPVFLLANLGQAVPGIGILVLLYAFLGLGKALRLEQDPAERTGHHGFVQLRPRGLR